MAVLQPCLHGHYEKESGEDGHHGVVGVHPAVLAFFQGLREEKEEQQSYEDPGAQRDQEVDLPVGERPDARKVRAYHRYSEDPERIDQEVQSSVHALTVNLSILIICRLINNL